MPFTGEQVNTYGPPPTRAFIIDATRSGLPVTVLHLYDHTTATMRGKLLSLATVVDAAGPEMDRSETVTVFNDLVVLAPGAIVDAPVQLDDPRRRARPGCLHDRRPERRRRPHLQRSPRPRRLRLPGPVPSVRRLARPSPSRTGRRPSPVSARPAVTGSPTVGEGRWNAPAPEGAFTYLEFHLDSINYNVDSAR